MEGREAMANIKRAEEERGGLRERERRLRWERVGGLGSGEMGLCESASWRPAAVERSGEDGGGSRTAECGEGLRVRMRLGGEFRSP